MNKKHIGLGIAIIAIAVLIMYFEPKDSASASAEDPSDDYSGPELASISGYINTNGEPITLSQYRGKVVLVDFWTYTCINCIRTLPHLVAWDEAYHDDGLVIIGVHTPEFDFEKDYDNVASAVTEKGIKYPVVLDNDYATWKAFNNHYWPHKYLIGTDGKIVYDYIGEGGYTETEAKIQELLNKADPSLSLTPTEVVDTTPLRISTPELYLGYSFALPRGQNIGNKGGLQPNVAVNYTVPTTFPEDAASLSGTWASKGDEVTTSEIGASLLLPFTASAVHVVASGNATIAVLVNGQPVSTEDVSDSSSLRVDTPRLYTVYRRDYTSLLLNLTLISGELSVNSFTFSS